jgi:ribose transport system ATP-binding protein
MQGTPEDVRVEAVTMAVIGVSKNFDAVRALRDVSFEIRPGEIHALLGENGAGKSTLMAVAAGTLVPDEGSIRFHGRPYDSLTPSLARELGIAIVHQHPALLPDMTVAENIQLSVPAETLRAKGSEEDAMRAMLDDVGMRAHIRDRVKNLTIAQKHLLEVAKAFALEPEVLILDEPTAPLGREAVDRLFEKVRAVSARGTAVVYITHRLQEVRLLANRVTVLRDGQVTGSGNVEEVSDDQLLRWIVGRQLESTFPHKRSAELASKIYLGVFGLSGEEISDVSFEARIGEIVGIAGVAGNGQSELLATLAGLAPFHGEVVVNGNSQTTNGLRTDAAYMPSDRHEDGLMMGLSVRENTALSALDRFKRRLLLKRSLERAAVEAELDSLAVKASSLEADVTSLSGGNQQKVVLARALLSEPRLLVADEPTQGVDVGARSEIYRILRDIAESGIPVVVASSDAQELEGLCDRVVVLSRGHAVAELSGEDVTEEKIIRAAVGATAHKREDAERARSATSPWRRFIQGDYAPVITLAIVIVALGFYIYTTNDRYISAFNITSVLMLVSALGFIAMGQTIALIIGGIDLSVGPLAGFLVVVGSHFINDDKSAATMLVGFVLMLVVALALGFTNGALVRFGRFTAVAATLTTYIAITGLSLVVRPVPGGLIAAAVTDAITVTMGPIPVVFLVLVGVSLLMEWVLRTRRWGQEIRAVGSDEESARRLGVSTNLIALSAFVAISAFVFLGSIVLMAQIGIGDPAQGVGYTLSSVTAVVLGGTSLLGGRGTFVGTLLGSFLIVQILNATVFLGLSQSWQYFFQGALILVAAVVYSQARGTVSGLRPVKGT